MLSLVTNFVKHGVVFKMELDLFDVSLNSVLPSVCDVWRSGKDAFVLCVKLWGRRATERNHEKLQSGQPDY
jgi:hypothetical protein